jgi:FkbM family methyltransferase
MTLIRTLVQAMDRPGGRALLSLLATRRARRATHADVSVTYDGVWMHRVGKYVFPDSMRFEYYGDSFDAWPWQAARHFKDAEDYWFHVYKPRAGDVIVDIGAGRGEDVLAFSQAVGADGLVVAVEANPVSFDLLQRFCTLNRLTNVRALPFAVADHAGTFHIETGDSWESHSLFSPPGHSRTVPVAGITLDELCRRNGLARIDFLKMNIEGAERLAVRGMTATLAMTRHVCIACHDFRADAGEGELYRTRALVGDFLERHGWTVVAREGDPRPWARDHVHAFRFSAL